MATYVSLGFSRLALFLVPSFCLLRAGFVVGVEVVVYFREGRQPVKADVQRIEA